jgi:hypothetical protein
MSHRNLMLFISGGYKPEGKRKVLSDEPITAYRDRQL